MKKANITYNNIIIKKKPSDSSTTPPEATLNNHSKTTLSSSKSEHNFEKILKQKHVIFKSKVTANRSPPLRLPSPNKFNLRKRSLSEHRDNPELEPEIQLNCFKKRYKLKAIEAFENSFDDDNGNVFEMAEMKNSNPPKNVVKKEVPSLTPPKSATTEKPSKKIFLTRCDSDDDKKVFSKENIESVSKRMPKKSTPSPVKSKQASPQTLENPYKKVYPEKKIRLNINNTSLTDDEDCKSFDLLKNTRTRGSLERLSLLKSVSSPETEKTIVVKKMPSPKLAKPEAVNSKKKTFSINIKSADLSDEDFDEIDTKKLIFKKSVSVETKPKTNQIFSAEFYEELEKDDLDLDTCSKFIFKKKSSTVLAESKSELTSPKQQLQQVVNDSPETKNRPKKIIFSSKRHEETTVKANICFNLNPNTEDTNFKVAVKESLNDAVCVDSNSSCSNSPRSVSESNITTNSSSKTSLRINFVDSCQRIYGKQTVSSFSSSSTGATVENNMLEIEFELRNSRKAYECEELGENQAFLDDIEYLFDGISGNYKLSDRCLCAIKLAESCLASEFRMCLRLQDQYINRIFSMLTDSTKFHVKTAALSKSYFNIIILCWLNVSLKILKSLALCTALVMFALVQDKQTTEIDKETFSLILSIVNMKPIVESMPTPPVGNNSKTKKKKLFKSSQEDESSATASDSSEDHELYKKIFSRCKDLTKKLINLGNEKNIQDKNYQRHQIFYSEESLNSSLDETVKLNKSLDSSQEKASVQNYIEFNEQLLAMECIFNMHLNKQHNVPVDWYKTELRLNKVFDKIMLTLGETFKMIKASRSLNTCSFYLNKYLRYFNFFECVMQSSTSALASFNILHSEENSRKKNLKAITPGENDTPTSVLNQNYLIHFENKYLTGLIKECLLYFYEELIYLKQAKLPNEAKQALIISSIKVNLLLMINLTHNNEQVAKEIALDKELIDLIFKCIADIVHYLNKEEQFDLLIMSMSILLNIFDSSSASADYEPLLIAKDTSTYDIIIQLYKDKENLVSLAEHDQDSEFKQLAEQLETQNEDNINTAIMNSIHKAGRHMEDHLIAAYSALLIGHIMQNDLIAMEEIRGKMKDNSFKYMALIIRKFLVFMKIMNVNGFSADQNVNKIIKFLENNG